jgi:hypothetical protein
MKYFITVIISLLLFSCSPEKRLARIIHNHPELAKKDTIWKKDTIYTKSVEKDTAFYYNAPDTVFINEGKMHVKYYFNKDSTVYIKGKCDADTVVKMYPQYINNITTKPLGWVARFKLWIVNNILWILLIGYIIYRIFGRAIKTVIATYLPKI